VYNAPINAADRQTTIISGEMGVSHLSSATTLPWEITEHKK